MSSQRLVHIVDDDAAVRLSLQRLLHSAKMETEVYDSAFAFLEAAPIARFSGGCLLLDMKMPGMGGLELQHRLNALQIRLPVIVLTAQGDVATAVKSMKAGAVDFIEKPFDDAPFLAAVENALATGGRPDMEREAMEAANRIAALTPRERAVLSALMLGRINKQIAYDLGISVRTVEAHRARMLERLETHGIAEAVRLAILASNIRAPFS
jgi:two-component system response regulator FixJ